MADKKISALTAASTPLAGTEVLPIVQSSATVKVSVANLTAGRAISATELTLTTGNLIVASGQGVDFSATSGTGTSELLDDYEEGTYTPAIMDGSNDPTELPSAAYTTRYGVYTKIGDRVFFNGRIVLNSIGTLNTAQGARFTLPFATNGSTGHAAFSIGDAFGFLIVAGQSISAYASAGGSFAVMQLSDSISGVSSLLISELTATGEFVFSGSFQV